MASSLSNPPPLPSPSQISLPHQLSSQETHFPHQAAFLKHLTQHQPSSPKASTLHNSQQPALVSNTLGTTPRLSLLLKTQPVLTFPHHLPHLNLLSAHSHLAHNRLIGVTPNAWKTRVKKKRMRQWRKMVLWVSWSQAEVWGTWSASSKENRRRWHRLGLPGLPAEEPLVLKTGCPGLNWRGRRMTPVLPISWMMKQIPADSSVRWGSHFPGSNINSYLKYLNAYVSGWQKAARLWVPTIKSWSTSAWWLTGIPINQSMLTGITINQSLCLPAPTLDAVSRQLLQARWGRSPWDGGSSCCDATQWWTIHLPDDLALTIQNHAAVSGLQRPELTMMNYQTNKIWLGRYSELIVSDHGMPAVGLKILFVNFYILGDEAVCRAHLQSFSQLAEIGFPSKDVHEALIQHSFDHQKALDQLITW